MHNFSFWFGVALAIIGCLMLVYTKEHAGANEVSVFGMSFKLSHPALVILVLGFVLIILERDGTPAPEPQAPAATTQIPSTAEAGSDAGQEGFGAGQAPPADSSAMPADASNPDRDAGTHVAGQEAQGASAGMAPPQDAGTAIDAAGRAEAEAAAAAAADTTGPVFEQEAVPESVPRHTR